LMPDVNSSFWILLVLASQLYMVMYIILFAAAIRLRYKCPDVPRAYEIPGGKLGMWCVAGLGILGSLAALVIGFFPPGQIDAGNVFFYELFLVGGIISVSVIPFIILNFKKPTWNIP
ncbi:MAG TPA: amino acid permease, partial [Chlamydiales bacterium]|nr:amino acid permease [Chlamydiales bacterium]